MTATAISLQNQITPFGQDGYFENLASATGLIIDDDECATLQEVFRQVQSQEDNCNLTWQEFYEDGFLPAYRENFRSEIIRRGRDGACDPCMIANDEQAYKLGLEAFIEENCGESEGALDIIASGITAGLGFSIAGFPPATVLSKPDYYVTDWSFWAVMGAGLSIGVYALKETIKGLCKNAKIEKKTAEILNAIAEDRPLRFDGYSVD